MGTAEVVSLNSMNQMYVDHTCKQQWFANGDITMSVLSASGVSGNDDLLHVREQQRIPKILHNLVQSFV
jgi:hypothetical protein